jgi:hypothetical protein
MDRPEGVVIDLAKIDADHLGAQSAAGRNGADTHLSHRSPPVIPNSSSIQPDIGQVLADVLVGGHVPAFDIGRSGQDTVVPEDRHPVRLGQRVAFEFANKTRALAPVDGRCLANAGARRDSGRSTRST